MSSTNSELLIYIADDGSSRVDVRLHDGTVWLSQAQIAELFSTSRENVSMHVKNVYAEGELTPISTRQDFLQVRTEGARDVTREITHYNLDLIISVGYRVKSKTATQFRIWATERLRDYLIEGVALNQTRLDELGQIVQVLARSANMLVAGSAEIISEYLPGLQMLRDYDEGSVSSAPQTEPSWQLTIDEARAVISTTAEQFPNDVLFGGERKESLHAVVEAIYQGFEGQQLYPTVEEQAANLIYLVVKDHPLTDGNKRSAAALFVTFLTKNGVLNTSEPRITNNALAAITLMIAMSEPREKALMIALVTRMLTTE